MIRATFAGFSTAYSALQANQKRLDITGNNLANMNTVGYTRQQLQTSSINYTHPVSHYMNGSEVVVGFGVHMDRVSQIRDPYLDIQYRSQMQKSGYTDAMQNALDRLSDVFDESQINGIHQAFIDVRSTLDDMQDPPKVTDPIYQSELRNRMQALTNLLNDADRQLTEAQKKEYAKLDGTGVNELGAIDTINDYLRQIGTLNRQIKTNQIAGQPSLELMDERNVLIDELSSYIPIEVTYYKDAAHDGIAADGSEAKNENFLLDGKGNVVGRRDWPDDLRIEMVYQEKDNTGTTISKRITLVEGTLGTGEENVGSVEITGTPDTEDPSFKLLDNITFNGFKAYNAAAPKLENDTVKFTKNDTIAGLQFADGSGSLQASMDMLWKDGKTAGLDDVRGYDYYRNQLDNLANAFATVMNKLNEIGGDGALLENKKGDGKDIDAGNIGISKKWISGDVKIATTDNNGDGNQNDTVLDMLEAMKDTYPNKILKDANGALLFDKVDLKNNSFADFMNYTSTVLANDSYSNTYNLKTNVTVLNGIQESRDSMSGVSLDEEASNMMMYMSAYNAASRLMTTLDQALDVLINNTGVVGR